MEDILFGCKLVEQPDCLKFLQEMQRLALGMRQYCMSFMHLMDGVDFSRKVGCDSLRVPFFGIKGGNPESNENISRTIRPI